MDPSKYQELAGRTECDQEAALRRISPVLFRKDEALKPTRLLHACLGLSGEVGELATAVEHWIYYGQPLDIGNVSEEIGDCLWYLAEACNSLGLNMEEIMEANIRKLGVRYPDKYEDLRAVEENRDRMAEQAAAQAISDQHPVYEQTGQGWAEPPEDPMDSPPAESHYPTDNDSQPGTI